MVGVIGTAPALVLELDGGCVAVVLPGPPSELQPLWADALETEPMRALLARAQAPEQRVLRFYGVSESASRRPRGGGRGRRRRRGHDLRAGLRDPRRPLLGARRRRAGGRARAPLRRADREYLYATEETPIEEVVLDLCRERGLTLATAESCTGGLVAARLTSVPGSSDVFLGAVVAYANEVKEAELGVPAEVLEAHGAVSRGDGRGDGARRTRAARRGRGRLGDRDRRARAAGRRRSRSGSSTCAPSGPEGSGRGTSS